ncbi:MAG TPA: hypothetical protein DCG57_05395, partial [Candidatus Riflebacteria bacterium]|jgi:peptidoglycan/xylan/chitin deacetylase (PgdA/CDA1 family)|nr:hypothetical protein [Candidatus Riflebacteria bacterium]
MLHIFYVDTTVMKNKLFAVQIFVCLVFTLATAMQLRAGNLLTMDTEAVGEFYEADRSALDKLLDSEEELINETFSDAGTYYNRPQLVKLLANTRKVILTFDDGPHPRTTPKILEILRRHRIKAVFFVLGLQAARYPELVKQIHDDGHLIGNHSYSHKNLAQISDEALHTELSRTSRLIESITGKKPEYLRPPYGAMNRKVVAAAKAEGMKILLWTIDPKDWLQKNEASILQQTERQLGMSSGNPRGGAVLLHDIYPSTVRALEPLIERLETFEYNIACIDNLDARSGNFWASAQPKLLRNASFYRRFDPELSGHRLLISILKPQPKNQRTAMAMLKAQKSGNLFAYLVKNPS